METVKENIKDGLWKRVLEIFLSSLPIEAEKRKAERCFGMITRVMQEDDGIIIYVNNSYAVENIEREYLEKIKTAFLLADMRISSIAVVEDKNSQSSIVVPEMKHETGGASSAKGGSFISTMPINKEYTFEEFVVGQSNSYAHAAAKGAANNPGKEGYNPLFIYGGTGLGKTHLMQAIGNEVLRQNPNASVCYLTAEKFLSEFVNSLQNGTITQFKDRYRNIDVLLVDDIQFLVKGPQFRQEFFDTFNALYQGQKQIVLTSDVKPKDLPEFEPRLISRFEGGMLLEIELPSYETRLAILKKKSESYDIAISEVILKYIAQNIKSHVRAMEGALRKVVLMLKVTPTMDVNEDTLNRLLKDFIEKEKIYKKININEIQKIVCDKYGITLSQMLSDERTQTLVTPRQLAMYIASNYTQHSFMDIAKHFHKSHATIMHGARNIKKRMDVEPELKENIKSILSEFGLTEDDIIR